MPANLLSKHYYYYTAILYHTMGDEVTVIIRSGFGSKCGELNGSVRPVFELCVN